MDDGGKRQGESRLLALNRTARSAIFPSHTGTAVSHSAAMKALIRFNRGTHVVIFPISLAVARLISIDSRGATGGRALPGLLALRFFA
jgi:hypothetical protein